MLGRDVLSDLGLSLRTKTAQTPLVTGMMMLSTLLTPCQKLQYSKQRSTTCLNLSRTHYHNRSRPWKRKSATVILTLMVSMSHTPSLVMLSPTKRGIVTARCSSRLPLSDTRRWAILLIRYTLSIRVTSSFSMFLFFINHQLALS
jgi:hypothetical protein